jgi:hypothetical protein
MSVPENLVQNLPEQPVQSRKLTLHPVHPLDLLLFGEILFAQHAVTRSLGVRVHQRLQVLFTSLVVLIRKQVVAL